MQPLVSVIVPVYNVEGYIERCARSLFDQTLDNIEYIFVDDCSPDNSIEVLQKVIDEYPQRKANVKIIRQEKNGGVAKARIAGIENAAGKYIAFCDSDDWVEPNMYKSVTEALLKNNAEVAVCDIKVIYPGRTEHSSFADWSHDKDQSISKYLDYLWGGTMYSLVTSRSVFDIMLSQEPEALEKSVGLTFSEDFTVTMRLLYYAYKVVNVHSTAYNYDRTRDDSVMNRHDQMYVTAICDFITSTLDIMALYGHKYPAVRRSLIRRLDKHMYHLGNRRKDFDEQAPGFIDSIYASKALTNAEKIKYNFFINCNALMMKGLGLTRKAKKFFHK